MSTVVLCTHINLCLGLAWINARCPPKLLDDSPSSAGQGRGNMMEGSRVETRREITRPLPSRTKLTELGEKKETSFITNQIRVGS